MLPRSLNCDDLQSRAGPCQPSAPTQDPAAARCPHSPSSPPSAGPPAPLRVRCRPQLGNGSRGSNRSDSGTSPLGLARLERSPRLGSGAYDLPAVRSTTSLSGCLRARKACPADSAPPLPRRTRLLAAAGGGGGGKGACVLRGLLALRLAAPTSTAPVPACLCCCCCCCCASCCAGWCCTCT